VGAGLKGPITTRVQDLYLRGVRGEVPFMQDRITIV